MWKRHNEAWKILIFGTSPALSVGRSASSLWPRAGYALAGSGDKRHASS
jgi:hypothetical protein